MESLPFKISTLIYVRNRADEILLLKRTKEPNKGLWSPIGGKLEMTHGESPFEAARRETEEEIGLSISDNELHLFSMITEKNYESSCHWLMFMFDCKTTIEQLPPTIDEGHFKFFTPEAIMNLPIPETDRQSLWPVYFEHRDGFVSQRADCRQSGPIQFEIEQVIEAKPSNKLPD